MKNLAFLFFAALPMLCSGMHTAVSKKMAADKKNTDQMDFVSFTNPPGFTDALAMPVHTNLWPFEAPSPSNNAHVEIIIHSFKFTP